MNIITISPNDDLLFFVGTDGDGNPMFSVDPCDSIIIKSDDAAHRIAKMFFTLNSNVL